MNSNEPLDLWYPTFRQPQAQYTPKFFLVHMDNDDRAWILCNVEVPFGMEPGDYDVRLAFGEKIIHGRLKRTFHRIIGSSDHIGSFFERAKPSGYVKLCDFLSSLSYGSYGR